MKIKFEFEEDFSTILGKIYRPVAKIYLCSVKLKEWFPIDMIIDTGADYTLLPKWYASVLEIDLVSDCKVFNTFGVGGSERVYLYKKKALTRLGKWERKITLGFLDSDEVPPLLGRHEFLETFRTTFDRRETTFEKSK